MFVLGDNNIMKEIIVLMGETLSYFNYLFISKSNKKTQKEE